MKFGSKNSTPCIELDLWFAYTALQITFHPLFWRKCLFATNLECFSNQPKWGGHFYGGPFHIWTYTNVDRDMGFNLFGIQLKVGAEHTYQPEKPEKVKRRAF